MKTEALSFENTEIAFKSKSNADLRRAYWLFKLISAGPLVRVGGYFTKVALKIGLPIQGIVKNTIFKHFCGGQSIADCEAAIRHLATYHVHTILDYSIERENSEAGFNATCEEILRTVERAQKDQHIPFSVFKVSGLGRFDLLQKVNAKEKLSAAEVREFENVKTRIDRICKASFETGLQVLIDAEYSWIQDIIDELALEMMRKYNLQKPIVLNTYQLYRTDKLASLKNDFSLAQTHGFYFGAKLVRGAYMEIERERAEENGYASPIHATKDATDQDYKEAIFFCLDHLDRIAFMAGTHNKESSRMLALEMDRREIAHNHPGVYFAQLLGMSDNLSFNLSSHGYLVAKYMPYGPVKAVMPYLLRRAQENTSVSGQTSRELNLIIKEIKRRKQSKKSV